ncbi:hypothetical protein BDA96_08G112200 [Sorghum bicolor]|uniref:Uncharacterized protein n=2 Tax=Sorghum bicolor TaxID=4558 RepID=A0A1Z5R5W9_SORBI|nr:hypothetical protein BDA96_08G112200 [Sorghum bicolor]OQU79147.1 hypothetical protein SORBI_3008G100950 [Sorghum bicolor]OQU79148.1 hypothetical protein SORBI_3008G100950 [Sorghum bicolor]
MTYSYGCARMRGPVATEARTVRAVGARRQQAKERIDDCCCGWRRGRVLAAASAFASLVALQDWNIAHIRTVRHFFLGKSFILSSFTHGWLTAQQMTHMHSYLMPMNLERKLKTEKKYSWRYSL